MAANGTLRVLIIDHYDSYTNNILQLLQGTRKSLNGNSYPEWSPAVIRFDQHTWEDFKNKVLPDLDAIILSPGPGRPDRTTDFGFNSKLIQEVNIPILGVCLGHQGIGTSFGAEIIHAPNIKHGQVSQITHTGVGILKDIPQKFDAVRYNSLLLDFDNLPPELQVTAWTYDVEDPTRKILMGLQHRERPIFGTQWHPESVCSAYGKQILQNFRDIALDFWNTPSSLNSWKSRSITEGASLPPRLVDECVIVKEAMGVQTHETATADLPLSSVSRPYYVKCVDLGKGPKAQDAFELFVRNSTLDGEVWLDSAKVRDAHSRNSYLAAGSFSLSYSSKQRSISFYQDNKLIQSKKLEESYWSWLNNFQSDTIQANTDALPPNKLGQETQTGQPIFQIGLVGYIGYEMKRESLPGYSFVPGPETQAHPQDTDTQYIFASTALWLDNYTSHWKLFGLVCRGRDDPIRDAIGAPRAVGLSESDFDTYALRIKEGFHMPPSPPLLERASLPTFVSTDNEFTYSASIEAARDAIREGESYEITMTTNFKAICPDENPFSLYLSLRARNPAPYSAFLNFPSTDTTILSSSPERFISIDRNGVAEMKPIKGTVAVSPDKVENERRKNMLANDKKELAENLMIVDLIRADLHNISPSISITVPKLLHVESYETVHQLVTTIQSHIAPSVGGVKVIERCFPPGSMTGAPKLRSVQILDVLEHHRDRGVYSGSLGYLCASGTVDQSVVIRTIVKRGNELVLGAGGAITWLSEADKEWDEVMVKANAVAKAEPLPTSITPPS